MSLRNPHVYPKKPTTVTEPPPLLRRHIYRFFSVFLLSSLVCGLIIGIYFDKEIRTALTGKIHSLPAHIYAKPLSIQRDTKTDRETILQELRQRGYLEVNKIVKPGSYAQHQNRLDVFFNPDPQLNQDSTAVRITFSEQGISHITDHRTGGDVNQVFLEPQHIGSLELGSYKDRISMELANVPELLIQTIMIMEDRNFLNHFGIDPKGILRALWSNWKHGATVQGASTLTQQLVKNLFLTPERTVSRKIIEALMSIVMELRFSKSEILQFYLNEVFLGQTGNRAIHGFALASEYYFGRSLQQLEPHQVALLVGIIPAPSFFNPRRHPARAKVKRDRVLRQLAQFGFLGAQSLNGYLAAPLHVIDGKRDTSSRFPTYTNYLQREIRQHYSQQVLRTEGLKFYTSLDPAIQSMSQQVLSDTLDQLELKFGIDDRSLQGSVVVVDQHRGEVVAMVGDRIKGYSGFNRALDAQRPIGSLVKPVVFLSALEQPDRFSLASLIDDSPLTIPQDHGEHWSPKNYDGEFRGSVSLLESLSQSLNIPTVKVGIDIGVEAVVQRLKSLGVDREISSFPSTLLGANQHTPLEVAQIYQPIANGGIRIPLRSVRAIGNHLGQPMGTLAVSGERVLTLQSWFLLDFALRNAVSQGTARRLRHRFPNHTDIAGKTGTTDDFRDSWFVGYNQQYLIVSWVGADDNKSTGLSGSRGALEVWANIFEKLPNLPKKAGQPKPHDNIVFAHIDPVTGLLANHRCDNKINLPFIQGYQPEDFAPCSGLGNLFRQWFKNKAAAFSNQGSDSTTLDPLANDKQEGNAGNLMPNSRLEQRNR